MLSVLAFALAAAQVATVHAPRVQARILAPKKDGKRHAGPPPVRAKTPSAPLVELHAVGVNETLRWRPGLKAGERALTRLLRCWHNGQQHRVDERLGRVLYQVARHYPGHRLEIFSGFRPRKYCTRTHSRHLTASAVDFRIDGVKNEALVAWLRQTFHPAGVGYYPNGVHVHLDVDRVRDTYWIDAGDSPSHDEPPLAEVGDTAPADVEATGDEAAEVQLPVLEPTEPPAVDPALD